MVEGPDTSKSEDAIQPKHEAPKKKFKEEKQPTKVVIRRLPGTMTEESFLEHVSPLFEHDYFYFVQGDCKDYNFSRAYINFVNAEDVFTFTQKFDDYVFIDRSGQEFPAVVEFAPFQRIPKNRANRKNDTACGTIEEDPEYQEFLQLLESEEQDHKHANQVTEHFFDLANDENEEKITRTPLIEYLTSKKNDWLKFKEEKKEERRKRDLERRKLKEETRRMKKVQKEAHKNAPERISKSKDDNKKDNENKHAAEDAKCSSSRVKGKSYQEERQRDLARRKQQEKPSGLGDMKETKNGDSDKHLTGAEQETENRIEVAKHESKLDCGDKNDSNYKKEDRKTHCDDDRRYGYGRDREDKKAFYTQKKHPTGYEYEKYKTSKRDGQYYNDYKTKGHSSYQKSGYTNRSSNCSKTKEQDNKPGKRYDSKRKGDDFKEAKKSHQSEKGYHPPENKDADKTLVAVESEMNSERTESLGQEYGSQDRLSNASPDGESKVRDSRGDYKRDERAERRIKNKDRPAQEIYRPGMGKFSRQKVERNKSTDSKDED